MRKDESFDLGILGGGQLARMLMQACQRLGFSCMTMVGSDSDPAALVGPHQVGHISDPQALREFLQKCRRVTFESEFVDADLVQKIAREYHCQVAPQSRLMMRFRDRLTQKRLFDQYQLPTAPWLKVQSADQLSRILKKWPQGYVLKKRLFGYDGYGTFHICSQEDIEDTIYRIERESFATTSGPAKNAADSKRTGVWEYPGFIAEQRIQFDRELAIQVACGSDQQFALLPWVETMQKNSRCLWVKGPLQKSKAMRQLESRFRAMLLKSHYRGVCALEVFDINGRLLVNEIAPRVHNSGHYSLDALDCDQFEYHVRAVLGLDLPTAQTRSSGFAMWNLLGGSKRFSNRELPSARLHWYGKSEAKPGRKMGHVNALADSPDRALQRAHLAARKLGFD